MAREIHERVCTVVAGATPEDMVARALSSPTKCVELRLDFLRARYLAESPEIVESLKRMGYRVVSTIRSRGEGGASSMEIGRVAAIYERLIDSGSDLVDIEYRRADHGVLERFRGQGILSIHEYGSPDMGLFENVVSKARRYGMIAKIAVPVDNPRDLSRLIGMASEDVTVVGMGRYSLIARALSLARGSSLTFAAHPEGPVVAPGQPSPEEIIAVYELVSSLC
ncbi:MAG: type I 3-dehydroquinate dehydratase [Desulfurococcales archaeon]|nr:type I 3-dehydroquinate dehydratase [Desulfurococcales archaeon]